MSIEERSMIEEDIKKMANELKTLFIKIEHPKCSEKSIELLKLIRYDDRDDMVKCFSELELAGYFFSKVVHRSSFISACFETIYNEDEYISVSCIAYRDGTNEQTISFKGGTVNSSTIECMNTIGKILWTAI